MSEQWKGLKRRPDPKIELLKRCLDFVEYQVDHVERKDSGDWAELDLAEASILLVDLQEVTR